MSEAEVAPPTEAPAEEAPAAEPEPEVKKEPAALKMWKAAEKPVRNILKSDFRTKKSKNLTVSKILKILHFF